MKKLTALLLALLLVIGFGPLAGYAEEADQALLFQSGETLERFTVLFANSSIPAGERWVVPERGALEIREGVTLTVYGHLEVKGELKVNGTLIILGWGEGQSRQRGSVSVVGSLVNSGEIRVTGGSLTNYPGALLENKGTLLLSGGREGETLLLNMTRQRTDRLLVGEIINSGELLLEAGGAAILNTTGAVIRNDGKVKMAEGAVFRGKMEGNPAERWNGQS
ncbi:MAG: hypothetical protein ACK5LX_04575 [Oscillospiraceae bacterium]